jgi:hypothetical protein
LEQLPWIEPHENAFGVRLLDCRSIATTFLSTTADAKCIRFLFSPESRSGEQFRGQHPKDAIQLACNLTYPVVDPLPEGPVFLPSAMEEKWSIYRLGEVLYFARSWTGDLQYAARLAEAASELRVVEVEAWPGNVLGEDQLAVRQVDFLIKSHIFNQTVLHPVPAFGTTAALALWSFNQYGRRGLFAAPEKASSEENGSPTG